MLVLRWLLLLMLVASSPAQARWLRAETPSFVVYSQGDEASLRKQAERLQDFDALLRMITGVRTPPSPTRVAVFIVTDNPQAQLFGIGYAIAGVYMADPGGIAALAGRSGPYARATDPAVLFHEYAHHFMFQYAAIGYPSWYVEGFAEYVATARLNGGVAELGRFDESNGYMLKSKAWMTLESLLLGGKERYPMFYPQAWITVHYMNGDPARRAALGRYLAALARNEDTVEAFERAFGMSVMQFQANLHDYSRSSDLAYQRIQWNPPPTNVTISELPASADRLLLLDLAVRFADDSAERRLLDSVRSEAAQWPGDRFAQTALARAEVQLGDVVIGQALVARLLVATPDDGELHYLQGVALTRAAAAKDLPAAEAAALRKSARIALTRANKLLPDDFRILYAHVRASERPISDTEYDVLLRVRELAPQVNSISLTTARIQIERNDIAAARKLLTVIASDTHDRSASESAAALLAKLDAAPAAALVPAAPSGS